MPAVGAGGPAPIGAPRPGGWLAIVQPLPSAEHAALRQWFAPERPGPLVYSHIVRTGHGRCLVDRWPDPRIVVAELSDNYSLRGDPDRLTDPDQPITGFVDGPEQFEGALRRLDPGVQVWPRVIFELPDEPATIVAPDADIRRLVGADDAALDGLSPSINWISATLGGATGLARSGLGWGAFVADRLVSVAVPFYLGRRYTDIGVVTEQAFRGRGLSCACAGGVISDIRRDGRRPTWSTSPDNAASLAVARRLGFRTVREDRLYAVRTPVPAPDG